jgi:hypothetical protein
MTQTGSTDDGRKKMSEQITEKSVRASLVPELGLIADPELRDKAVQAWTMSCRIGGYSRLEDVPTEMYHRHPNISNINHQKHVVRIAKGILDSIAPLKVENINEDYVLTACLCHDVGKPCEWRAGQRGLYVGGTFYGPTPDMPQLEDEMHYQVARHSVWGFYISREGEGIERSPEAIIVNHADHIWWSLVGNPRDTKKSHWRQKASPRVKES